MSDPSTPTHAGSESAPVGHPAGRRRLRLRWFVAGGAALVVLATATVVATGGFAGSRPRVASASDPTALAPVQQRSLSSQVEVSATLGYAADYTVVDPAPGTVTALPAIGAVISQGQDIYSVNGTPTVLLYGSTPAYRPLSDGMRGADVRELNADLVSLGYLARGSIAAAPDYYGAATARAVGRLQAHLGLPWTGRLMPGQAVFLPSAARVTAISATLGAPARPGSPVLQATSTTREVIVQLDANQQSEVKVGDQVTITMPDNQTTPGVVTSVGTVATSPPSGGGSGSSGSGNSAPTIEVDVKPTDPSATGSLDQAPVNVTITTASVENALVVPVDALLARASGGYAVEVSGSRGRRHLLPVSLGLFDDADGLVQVTGSGLAAGQKLVVPKI